MTIASKAQPIRSILIVGGGTAGWMAAALLNQALKDYGCTITQIESSDIDTIGVGEATIPDIVRLIHTLGLEENEFMRRCEATYKLGIKFEGWVEGSSYWHPFGGGTINGLDLFHYWLRSVREVDNTERYSDYSLQALLCEQGKAPRSAGETSPIIKHGSYAYHLDALAFATLLKGLSLAEGVNHHVDKITTVQVDEHGRIDCLKTKAGRQFTADLYLDCSGFDGILIEKALKVGWIDWSKYLLCNRAVVAMLPTNEQMPPYTRSTAMEAGWMWNIPLSHRSGAGYVYSSQFLTQQEATAEFLLMSQPTDCQIARPRHLEFRVGRRDQFWKTNCVSVGLSAGFLEPLESTGLMFIQRAIEDILNFLPDCRMNEAMISEYNRQTTLLYNEARDFILLHYLLNQRKHHEFWHASREVHIPNSLQQLLDQYDETGLLNYSKNLVFREPSYYSILSGSRRLPVNNLPMVSYPAIDKVLEALNQIKSQAGKFIERRPSHAHLMQQTHN